MSLKEQSQGAVKQEIPRLIQRYCERLSYEIIIITETLTQPNDHHSKVKNLLKLYAPKLKWQRYPDNRLTTQQPYYETQLYQYFNSQSNNDEEEMIYRFFIEIKDSLTLAYEAEANANYHHFSVGAKLCML